MNEKFRGLPGDQTSLDGRGHIDPSNLRVVLLMAAVALVAVVVLVVDHFSRVSSFLLFFSGFLICATVAYLVTLALVNRRAKAEAARAQHIRSASAELATYCVISVDLDHRIVEWNKAATSVFGYSREEAIGSDGIELLVPEDSREQYLAMFDEFSRLGIGEDGSRYIETKLVDSAGCVFPVEISFARITSDPPMFTGFMRSLTERRLNEEENSRLAAIVRSSDDAIVSVDLEGRIMSWNDGAERIFGFTADVVQGQRLSDLTFPPGHHEKLGTIFRRVMSGASGEMKGERVTRDGTRLWVSSRAFPIRGLNGEVVGMSLVSHEISEEVRKEEKIQGDRERQHWCDLIKQSLETDGFVFWGQPVFHTGSPVISHYELLIRMVRDGRVFMPDHFLGNAEDSGLIEGIDRWAVNNGIRLSRQIPVAINLSGKALTEPKLIDFIAQSIKEHDAEPSRVRFEITETSAIEDLHNACLTVKALKESGCLVSLDDFGTGYSSFTYLKNLPVDELKIDRSFVSDLASSESSRHAVESMIATAHNFSIDTVAEGIEDEATALIVGELGIDLSQGYFMGRPAPLDDIVENEERPHIATA